MADRVWERTGVQEANPGSKVRLQVGTNELGRPIWGEEKTVASSEKMTDGDEEKLRLIFTDGTKSKDWGSGSSSGFTHSNKGFIATKQADPSGRLPGEPGYTHPLGLAGLERDRENQRREEQRQDRERAAAIERERSGENDNGGGGSSSGGSMTSPWNINEFAVKGSRSTRGDRGQLVDRSEMTGSVYHGAGAAAAMNDFRLDNASFESTVRELGRQGMDVFEIRDFMGRGALRVSDDKLSDIPRLLEVETPRGFLERIKFNADGQPTNLRRAPLTDSGVTAEEPTLGPVELTNADRRAAFREQWEREKAAGQEEFRPRDMTSSEIIEQRRRDVAESRGQDLLQEQDRLRNTTSDVRGDIGSGFFNPNPDSDPTLLSRLTVKPDGMGGGPGGMGLGGKEFQTVGLVAEALRNGEISHEEAVAEIASIEGVDSNKAVELLQQEQNVWENFGPPDVPGGPQPTPIPTAVPKAVVNTFDSPDGFGSSGSEADLSAESILSQTDAGRRQLFAERQAELGSQNKWMKAQQARRLNTQTGLYEMGLGLGDIGAEESFLDFIDDAGGITANTRAGFGTGARNQRAQLDRVAQLLSGNMDDPTIEMQDWADKLALNATNQFNLGINQRLQNIPGAFSDFSEDRLRRTFQNAFDIDRFGEVLGEPDAFTNPFGAFVGEGDFGGELGNRNFNTRFKQDLGRITDLFGSDDLSVGSQQFIDDLSANQGEQFRMAMAARRPQVPINLRGAWDRGAQDFFKRWQAQNRGTPGAPGTDFLPFMQEHDWEFSNKFLN
jgi:hypothetical protein